MDRCVCAIGTADVLGTVTLVTKGLLLAVLIARVSALPAGDPGAVFGARQDVIAVGREEGRDALGVCAVARELQQAIVASWVLREEFVAPPVATLGAWLGAGTDLGEALEFLLAAARAREGRWRANLRCAARVGGGTDLAATADAVLTRLALGRAVVAEPSELAALDVSGAASALARGGAAAGAVAGAAFGAAVTETLRRAALAAGSAVVAGTTLPSARVVRAPGATDAVVAATSGRTSRRCAARHVGAVVTGLGADASRTLAALACLAIRAAGEVGRTPHARVAVATSAAVLGSTASRWIALTATVSTSAAVDRAVVTRVTAAAAGVGFGTEPTAPVDVAAAVTIRGAAFWCSIRWRGW